MTKNLSLFSQNTQAYLAKYFGQLFKIICRWINWLRCLHRVNFTHQQCQYTVTHWDDANRCLWSFPHPIPAEILISTKGDSIILNGTGYNLKLVNMQQRQVLITANYLATQSTAATHQASVSICKWTVIHRGRMCNLVHGKNKLKFPYYFSTALHTWANSKF